jgi:hypothetical protein
MLKQIVFIFILFRFTVMPCLGQKGNVTVHADERIEDLVKKEGTPVPPATQPQINGYRVQLLFESERKLIEEARSKFITLYPKVDTYVVFAAPNFVLKAGDFRTYLEAECIRDKVFRDFPTGFITKESVNLPRVDQE